MKWFQALPSFPPLPGNLIPRSVDCAFSYPSVHTAVIPVCLLTANVAKLYTLFGGEEPGSKAKHHCIKGRAEYN